MEYFEFENEEEFKSAARERSLIARFSVPMDSEERIVATHVVGSPEMVAYRRDDLIPLNADELMDRSLGDLQSEIGELRVQEIHIVLHPPQAPQIATVEDMKAVGPLGDRPIAPRRAWLGRGATLTLQLRIPRGG